MFILIQILAILGMFFMTYIAFLSFGAPKKNLLFTKADKEDWDKSINTGIGKWFTVTNVVGTLTSLATAYLFFIGNSKPFGWVIFMCAITIWLGSFVTNYFSKKILSNDYLQKLIESKEQIVGVIATLFWRPNNPVAQRTSWIVRSLSILNIVSVIWLEFALFSDIAGRLFSIGELQYRVVVIFVCSFAVLYFTVKYGLRGFVFADIFQSPIIAISALSLVIGSIILFTQHPIQITPTEFLHPLLPSNQCLLFALHVTFLNSFFVLVTEGHWLRIWIFGKRETDLQVKSLSSTAIIWLLLILIGFFSFFISGSKTGEDAIISLLIKLNNISPIFIVLFWLGAVGALFSTADAQIYSFLLVNEFDNKKGVLNNKVMDKINPLFLALGFSILFSLAYFIVRYFGLPFEKIVYIVMPLSLNLLPAFVRASKGYEQKPILIIISVILYLCCSIVGFFQPDNSLAWTLCAALMPFICSVIAFKK